MSEIQKGSIISNINEAYLYAARCEPFEIHKAILSSPGRDDREVFIIGLRGTNQSFDRKDPLGIPVCLRSGCSKDNIYLDLVKKTILNLIPFGSDLVFMGHSLGGMVCQQVAADFTISSSYNVLNVLTMGSPYIISAADKIPLHRMADKFDIIPNIFSKALLANYFLGDVKHEDSGSFGDPLRAHCESYKSDDSWKKYDCFGIEDGGNYVTVTETVYK